MKINDWNDEKKYSNCYYNSYQKELYYLKIIYSSYVLNEIVILALLKYMFKEGKSIEIDTFMYTHIRNIVKYRSVMFLEYNYYCISKLLFVNTIV